MVVLWILLIDNCVVEYFQILQDDIGRDCICQESELLGREGVWHSDENPGLLVLSSVSDAPSLMDKQASLPLHDLRLTKPITDRNASHARHV